MRIDEPTQTSEETVVETVRSAGYGVPPTRAQRDQLKALSTEVFGVSSKYQKFFEGKELVTRKQVSPILDEKGEPLADGSTKTEDVPVLLNGSKQYRMKYRSADDVITLLLEFKAKRDTFLAEMKAKTEAAKKKKEEQEAAAKINETLAGSALT